MEQKIYAKIVKYVLVVFIVSVFFFPIYWTITMAFKPHMEWTSSAGGGNWIPKKPPLTNFSSFF